MEKRCALINKLLYRHLYHHRQCGNWITVQRIFLLQNQELHHNFVLSSCLNHLLKNFILECNTQINTIHTIDSMFEYCLFLSIYCQDTSTLNPTTTLASSWKLSQHVFDQELEVVQITQERLHLQVENKFLHQLVFRWH